MLMKLLANWPMVGKCSPLSWKLNSQRRTQPLNYRWLKRHWLDSNWQMVGIHHRWIIATLGDTRDNAAITPWFLGGLIPKFLVTSTDLTCLVNNVWNHHPAEHHQVVPIFLISCRYFFNDLGNGHRGCFDCQWPVQINWYMLVLKCSFILNQ